MALMLHVITTPLYRYPSPACLKLLSPEQAVNTSNFYAVSRMYISIWLPALVRCFSLTSLAST